MRDKRRSQEFPSNQVCFTGKLDVTFLQKGDDSTQTVTHTHEPTPDLTYLAHKARDRLRWGENLQRKKLRGVRLKREEEALLEDLAAGKLHDEANDATHKSGFGRIKHRDGTFEDIALHNGGIVRSVLDKIAVGELCEEEPYEEVNVNPYLHRL